MNGNSILKIIILIVFILLLLSGGYFIIQRKPNILSQTKTESTLPNYLFLTNPVNEYTGKVDKISGDVVWVSGKYTITPPPTPINAPTNKPGSMITVPPLPPSKTFTYQVTIAPYTIINRASTTVTYLIKKITPSPTPKLIIKDIRVGQTVTVYTDKDLRTLNSNEFEAYSIKLPPVNNKITGKISEIKDKEGIIILKATPPIGGQEPTPEKPKEVEYAVLVNSDTEISLLIPTVTPKAGTTPKPPQPVNFTISDLKKDMQITIYTEADVIESQQLKALRIEPPIAIIPTTTPKPT
jgi:hypothetical protein